MSNDIRTYGNPAPLGLLGFGMTTILLNIHNAGFYPIDAMVIAMGIFYGGMCQLIAGKYSFKMGNTFGGVVFTSYGAFWLTLVALWMIPKLFSVYFISSLSLGIYLIMWGLLTLGFFFGTLKGNTIGKLIFGTLVILFFLLGIGNITGNHALLKVAGYEGILCGALACYEGIALILQEKLGKKFPLL